MKFMAMLTGARVFGVPDLLKLSAVLVSSGDNRMENPKSPTVNSQSGAGLAHRVYVGLRLGSG